MFQAEHFIQRCIALKYLVEGTCQVKKNRHMWIAFLIHARAELIKQTENTVALHSLAISCFYGS